MGRKKKPDYFKKSKLVKIRMTQNDYNILKELANNNQISMSEFIRNLVIDKYLKK